MCRSLQELLKHSKCEVNVQGFMASTPLHIAAQTDNVEICKKLVRKIVKRHI